MEKVIIVLQGHKWAKNAIDFACYLSEESRSRITGYFLEEPSYEAVPRLRDIGGTAYVESIVASDIPGVKAASEFTERSMENFLQHCAAKGIVATATRVEGDMLDTIIGQTRFADLLVVDAATVAGPQPPEKIPSPEVQKILAEAQCPVIIAPVAHMHPEEVIFCYDGSPSSVFAMKQFAYILPHLEGLKATAVKVGEEPADESEIQALTTWMSRHFAFQEYVALPGSLEKNLYPFVVRHSKPIVVMGAYGRGALSRFFNRSSADYFVETLGSPIFIAHL